jgi:hypothetical protein
MEHKNKETEAKFTAEKNSHTCNEKDQSIVTVFVAKILPQNEKA